MRRFSIWIWASLFTLPLQAVSNSKVPANKSSTQILNAECDTNLAGPSEGRSPIAAPSIQEQQLKPLDAVAEWQKQNPLYSLQWIFLSTRDPMTPLFDSGYPARLHDGLANGFAPWWFQIEPNLTFSAALHRQHSITASGMDGSQKYYGGTRAEENQRRNWNIAPGKFRYELHPELPNDHYSFSFRINEVLGEVVDSKIEAFRKAYRSVAPKFGESEPTSGKYVDTLNLRGAAVDVLAIPRLEGKVLVWNEYGDQYVSHHYSKNSETILFENAMGEVMGELRELWIKHQDRLEAIKFEMLHRLAEYAYLGIHAHLGNGANFSVTMADVNFVLQRWKLNGISHANLDFVGLLKDFNNFEKRFVNDIAIQNPGLKVNQFPIGSWHPVRDDSGYLIRTLEIGPHLEHQGCELIKGEGDDWPKTRIGKIKSAGWIKFSGPQLASEVRVARKIRIRVATDAQGGQIDLRLQGAEKNYFTALQLNFSKTGGWLQPEWIEADLLPSDAAASSNDIFLHFSPAPNSKRTEHLFDVWEVQLVR